MFHLLAAGPRLPSWSLRLKRGKETSLESIPFQTWPDLPPARQCRAGGLLITIPAHFFLTPLLLIALAVLLCYTKKHRCGKISDGTCPSPSSRRARRLLGPLLLLLRTCGPLGDDGSGGVKEGGERMGGRHQSERAPVASINNWRAAV